MRYLLAAFALLLLPTASAQLRSEIPIPDTPAGRFLATWLGVHNAADPNEVARYNRLYHRQTSPQDWIGLYRMIGRVTPLRVEAAGPNQATMLVAAEYGDSLWQERVVLDPADPMKVVEATFQPADRPPELAIPRVSRAELERMMEQRLAHDVAADRFAGTIVVQRHGRVIYQRAVGLADRSANLPVTMDTRFRIGSANKMFTAVAVLQLVEQGRVSLDAPIGTYLRDYPNAEFARNVTVRQLLSHTGGAGDIFTAEYQARRLQVRTLADYVNLFGSRAADTSADGRNAYANYGFILLGRIIETVSGEDYYDYVQRHIFAPAGMTETGSLPEDLAVPNRSRGYTMMRGATLADNADTLPWRGTAAGGGYTTAMDLVRFADALRSGRLLSSEMLAQATSPQRPDGWYGFGFWIGGQGPTRNWGHGGGAPGMNAALRIYPELDAVVVALANLDPVAADNQADFYANRMALDE